MATKGSTLANGALSFDQFYQIAGIWERYYNTSLVEYDAFAAKRDIDDVLARRAQKSWTAQEIRKAVADEFDYCQIPMPPAFLDDLIFRLHPSAPKTPEERITVTAGRGYFSVYKIDGEIVSDANIVSALASALREAGMEGGDDERDGHTVYAGQHKGDPRRAQDSNAASCERSRVRDTQQWIHAKVHR